ncbi:MAG: LamG-like jellyroll fold domain-containing protein [Patescibacteria group bacterium]
MQETDIIYISVGFNQIAFDSPYQMRIGNNPINNGYFPGIIDDVRIYNRALSAAEILAIYNATK